MARKRFRKVSIFRSVFALLVLFLLGVCIFVMGGRNPETAKDVEKFSKETATDLLDRGKEALENKRE